MPNSTITSIIAITIIFAATTLGSAFVFFMKKKIGEKTNTMILGFAGGIMVAASLFGLLIPSINQTTSLSAYDNWSFVPPVAGFLLGGLMLYGLDKLVPHLHKNLGTEVREGPEAKSLSDNFKFFLAVTIHNIPEGLSVGLACGLALSLTGDAAVAACGAALFLAIGIAIQNIPEGAAVSIPMYGDGMSKGKAFLFGSASGIVEPIFAVAALFLGQLTILSPWLLSFAAGAMIYVTLDEILPESRQKGFPHIAMWSFMVGFAVMMVLEVVL